MNRKAPPKWVDLKGENIDTLSKTVNYINDIPFTILKSMKMKAAKYEGCVLFVDLSDFYGSKIFPMRKINQVYYYWGTLKE